VPGWVPKQGEGREAWSIPVEQVVALGETLGVPLAKPGVITPGQARKAGLDSSLTDAFARRPPGEIKLVRSDNPLTFSAFAAQRGTTT
jgi:hypothetical protein